MMSRLLRWFPGWVRVEAEGGYPERLLNEMAAAGIPVWHLRRREEWIRFSCPAADYRRLRPAARRACLRMRVRQKHGLPFWRHRYRHRKGLLVGLVLYGVVLALLAPRIWVIQVSGNVETPTEEILAVAAQRGVRLGARMDAVEIKELQLQGTGDLDRVAHITVNPSYCVARIEVTEREPTPQVIDLSQPSDLVAICDGVILEIEARSGMPLVKVGEGVTAGTTLITGRVQSPLGEKQYRSYGAVWAQTRRRITLSVPLVYTRYVPAGKAICRPTLSLLCWDFPLYSKTPLQGKYVQETARRFPTVGEITLPLGITTDYYLPMAPVQTARTAAEAERLAREQLAEQEKALFLPDSYEKQTENGRIKDGQYLLTATYLCRENIAAEVPLAEAPAEKDPAEDAAGTD